MSEVVYVVDGSGYIFRAFYAPMSPLSAPDGTPTKAVIGFAKMIRKLFRERKPELVAMTFDPKGDTFRHEIYEDYKANRHETPEDLVPQFPLIREFVRAVGLPVLEAKGYEADDVIATLTQRALEENKKVVIVSADKDLMQLVGDDVSMYDPMRDRHYDAGAVQEKFFVPPTQVRDLLALTGDTSDNVPGVPKVGPKSAAKLLEEFGDLESVIAGLADREKPKAYERSVLEHQEEARLSQRLVSLDSDVPVDFDWPSLRLEEPDKERLGEYFRKIGAFRLMQEFGIDGKAARTTSAPAKRAVPVERKDGPPPSSVVFDPSSVKAETLRTPESLDAFLSRSPEKAPLGIFGFGLAEGVPCGLGIAHPKDAAYLPLGHRLLDSGQQMSLQAVTQRLSAHFKESHRMVTHGMKSLLRYVDALEVQEIDDTMIQAYVVNPSRPSFRLSTIAQSLFQQALHDPRDLFGSGRQRRAPDEVGIDEAAPVASELAAAVLSLDEAQSEQIRASGASRLYAELERPLIPVLGGMQRDGILVDTKRLRELQDDFGARLQKLEAEAHEFAGEAFNLGSPKQLGAILFDKLGLPVIKKTKTGYSTNHEVLEKLSPEHPLPDVILQYRELSKLKSTYVDGLLELGLQGDHRIHTTFKQTGAATGRLSSTDPNIQNIPIRSTDGKKIREAFVAAPGHNLISADYSQIELRVMAHFSLDQSFLDAFKRNEDIHARTAREVITDGDDPTPEARRKAKAINFGILYGLSEYGLSKQLDISFGEAKDFIGRYFARYPVIRSYLDESIEEARERGWSETILGRRRYLPDLQSRNQPLRQAAERVAMNTPIQGSAADIIKLAMLEVDKALQDSELPARMLLQVHDELLLECEVEVTEEVAELTRRCMSRAIKLAVPLVVDVQSGANWAEIH